MDEKLVLEIENVFINSILDSENAREILDIWKYAKSKGLFADVKICKFSDEIGSTLPEGVRSSEYEDFSIFTLTNRKKIFYLDDTVCDEMDRIGKANYNIRTCVCLDTQAVSYLKNPLGLANGRILLNNSDINTEVLHKMGFVIFLLRKDIDYSTELYLLENSQKINQIDMNELYVNLCAIERFLAIDNDLYRKSDNIKVTISESEVFVKADIAFNFIKEQAQTVEAKAYFEMQKFIYALLLKMCEIELKYGKKSAKNKMIMLASFVNDELGCFAERELILCYLYWQGDEKIKPFFRKIKGNNSKIISDIQGMAWDLFHIRHMEKNLLKGNNNESKIEIDSMITFDVGLQNVIRASSLKGMVIKAGVLYPIYEKSFENMVKELKNLVDIFPKGVKTRLQARENCNLNSLICELESSVKNVIGALI